ncbi:hypothetical protein CDAR_525351 [Caerostris darwini]|uniref:Uncharacterized protein n=1 Tax=Caerostris darwini TaxID=1538125 RepID=A0AAV4RIX8_9ARAC|nr:hypothetical protein CDAR_525351 [Caerostris darwini]
MKLDSCNINLKCVKVLKEFTTPCYEAVDNSSIHFMRGKNPKVRCKGAFGQGGRWVLSISRAATTAGVAGPALKKNPTGIKHSRQIRIWMEQL